MSAHTPGPWKVDYAEAVHVREESGASICIIGHLKGDRFGSLGRKPAAESNANARLIAVAPELLSAAEEVLSEINPPETPAEHKLAAAVAKAKAEGRK